MLPYLSILGLVGLLISLTSATALTYNFVPNEKECFYTYVDKRDAKIAFYFAVQSGGSFDSMSHIHNVRPRLLGKGGALISS